MWKGLERLEQLMTVMLLTSVFLLSRHAGLMVSSQSVTAKTHRPVVVLDSGHGGCNLRDLKNQNRIAACMLREVGRPLSCGLCNY